METISINTHSQDELLDITDMVQQIVTAGAVQDGIVQLICQHTTAGITINENADPDVQRDILMALKRVVADNWPYKHGEGNSPAHLKSSLVGATMTVPISDGRLVLGRWQGIFFCEFDGPRAGRKVVVTLINNGG